LISGCNAGKIRLQVEIMKKFPPKYRLFALVLFVFAAGLYANSIVKNLRAYPLEDKILLSWETSSEQNLARFQIERSTDGKTFFAIAYVDAKKEPAQYEFIDNSVFAKPTASAQDDRQYSYRLKLLYDDNGSDYTESVSVTPLISGTRHTWGSIKALFK